MYRKNKHELYKYNNGFMEQWDFSQTKKYKYVTMLGRL